MFIMEIEAKECVKPFVAWFHEVNSQNFDALQQI